MSTVGQDYYHEMLPHGVACTCSSCRVIRERDEALAKVKELQKNYGHAEQQRVWEQDRANTMSATIVGLREDNDRLRALLREWWESVDECPFCGRWKTDHAPDCRLAAALEGP